MTRSRRRSYGTIRDASAYGGKVSTGDRPNYARPAGRLAWYDGTCGYCSDPITRHADMLILRRGEWIHVHHAAGQDDDE